MRVPGSKQVPADALPKTDWYRAAIPSASNLAAWRAFPALR